MRSSGGARRTAENSAEDICVQRVAVSDGIDPDDRGDTQVRTRRARCGSLSGRSGIASATLRATRFTAGIAADSAHESGFEREHGAAAERDQQAAAFDEILNLRKTLIANAAVMSSDSAGIPKLGVSGVFLKAHRAPALGNAWICSASSRIDVPIEQDVNFVVEFAGADVFVAEIGVGTLRWSSE